MRKLALLNLCTDFGWIVWGPGMSRSLFVMIIIWNVDVFLTIKKLRLVLEIPVRVPATERFTRGQQRTQTLDHGSGPCVTLCVVQGGQIWNFRNVKLCSVPGVHQAFGSQLSLYTYLPTV